MCKMRTFYLIARVHFNQYQLIEFLSLNFMSTIMENHFLILSSGYCNALCKPSVFELV